MLERLCSPLCEAVVRARDGGVGNVLGSLTRREPTMSTETATVAVYPNLRYRDAAAAIGWLERTLGVTGRDPQGNLWAFGTYRPVGFRGGER